MAEELEHPQGSIKEQRQWAKNANKAMSAMAKGLDVPECEDFLLRILPNLARVAADETEGRERNAARAAKTLIDVFKVLGVSEEAKSAKTAIQVNIDLGDLGLTTSTLQVPAPEKPPTRQE